MDSYTVEPDTFCTLLEMPPNPQKGGYKHKKKIYPKQFSTRYLSVKLDQISSNISLSIENKPGAIIKLRISSSSTYSRTLVITTSSPDIIIPSPEIIINRIMHNELIEIPIEPSPALLQQFKDARNKPELEKVWPKFGEVKVSFSLFFLRFCITLLIYPSILYYYYFLTFII